MINDFIGESSECNAEQSGNMEKTIKKVASLTQIPPYHVVNAWSVIRDPTKSNVASDNVHPNAQGMGAIA